MSNFKMYMESLSPEIRAKYADVTNATEFIMAELYNDEELLDEELNKVTGGSAAPTPFRCKCGSTAYMADHPGSRHYLVCYSCYDKGIDVPVCQKCGSKLTLDKAKALLDCPECSSAVRT